MTSRKKLKANMVSVSSNISATLLSADQPSDIVLEIFTRLPVKSLCRFKSVSKSMYLMLHSPNFIKQHINRAMQKDPSMILRTDMKLYAANEDDQRQQKARKIQLPFGLSLEKVEILGSCNGLLCISDQQLNEDIYIYNPSTRVYRLLPTPEFDVPSIKGSCLTSLGFGIYQNDYKLLRCVYLYDQPFGNVESYQSEARIYSFSANTWRKIGEDIPYRISSAGAITFGDNFIWTGIREVGRGVSKRVLAAFDLEREEFWEIPRPEIGDQGRCCELEVGVIEERFSLYHMWRSDRVEIWSMEEFGLGQSWRKLFVVGPNLILEDGFLYLKPLFVLKNGKILIEQREGQLILYDPRTQTATKYKIPGAPGWFRVTCFVGSLVSPSTTTVKSCFLS